MTFRSNLGTSLSPYYPLVGERGGAGADERLALHARRGGDGIVPGAEAPMVARIVVLVIPSQVPGQGIVRSQDSTERSWFKVSRFCYMLMKYSCDRRRLFLPAHPPLLALQWAAVRADLRSARSADFPLDLDLFPSW